MFSDTPPAPSFQSILCKLQPLTRHSVRHLPYNIGMLPCVNLQLIYLKQLCAVAILHRVLPAFCAEHSRNVLEKRTGYPRNSCILHRVFPLPCPAVTRVPVGKPHRIGPFPMLQFTQVWLFLAYLQLYAGCFPHRKMVVECTGCSWLNTQVCVVKLHRLYLLLI